MKCNCSSCSFYVTTILLFQVLPCSYMVDNVTLFKSVPQKMPQNIMNIQMKCKHIHGSYKPGKFYTHDL